MATFFVGAEREFTSIQAAINAASDGDTIIIDAGNYDEDPVVNKSLTIQGPQAGASGANRDPANSAGEANILGNVTITAEGNVTIDGVRIVNDTPGGVSLDIVSTGTTGHVFTNSIIFSTIQGGNQGDIAIAVRPGATGTTTISANAISGAFTGAFSTASFERGIFFDGGGRDLFVSDNLFERTRTAINLDMAGDSEVTVAGNTFRTAGTGIAVSQDADGLTVRDNDIAFVDTDFSFRNTTVGVTFDAGTAIDELSRANAGDLVKIFGGSGADTLTGSEFDDIIDGNNSPTDPNATDADTLNGMAGNDQIFGRGGNDTLNGGDGDDVLDGGDGDDILNGGNGIDTLNGGAGNDTLNTGAFGQQQPDGEETQNGGDGDDLLIYQGGRVNNNGGEGFDTLQADFSNFRGGVGTFDFGTEEAQFSNLFDENAAFTSIERFIITGSNFGDSFTTGSGNDIINSGGGDDRVDAGDGDDTIDGGDGNDMLNGGRGNDTIRGGAGNDTIDGGEGNDRLFGNDGDDTITGGAGDDVVFGGAGRDLILLQDGGDDVAFGGADNDRFFFGGTLTAADVVVGGTGTDAVILQGNYSLTLGAETFDSVEFLRLLSADEGEFNYFITTVDENVAAGANLRVDGRDLEVGESLIFDGSRETDGTFTLLSGAGNDTLAGGARNDLIEGGRGNDRLFGLGGDDVLVGGEGTDQLRGGFGNDIFRFDRVEDSTTDAPDRIVDFGFGQDKIDLSRIDANETEEGDQAFSYIGEASFSNRAGELRSTFDSEANAWRVEGDTDGDGMADFAIHVVTNGQMPLITTDFVL